MAESHSEEAKSVLEKLCTFYINCLLEYVAPEVVKEYPGYPNDAPAEFLYQPKKPPKVKNGTKITSVRAKKNDGKVKIPLKRVDLRQDTELDDSLRKTRRSRFQGSYKLEKPDFESEASNEKTDIDKKEECPQEVYPSVSKEEFLNTLKICESVKNGFSDASQNKQPLIVASISGEKVKISKSFMPKKTILNGLKEKPNKIKSLSDTSSDEEEVMEQIEFKNINPVVIIPKCDDLVESYSAKRLRAAKNSSKIQQVSSPKQTHNAKNPQNSNVLKTIFKNSGSFDEAMKVFAEKKKELINKLRPPKIIPAPISDPAVKQLIRKKPIKQSGNPNHHLGGIFTINNGWDKVKMDEEKQAVPMIQRKITPPKIVNLINFDDDIMDAHNEFMYNDKILENFLMSENSSSTLSPPASNHNFFQDSGIDSEGAKILCAVRNNADNSESTSSDEDEIKPKKKLRKLSYCSDYNDCAVGPSENLKKRTAEDHDVISIHADFGEFDDFDDITKPSEVYSEVNDLKMKIVQVKPKSLDPETEFEINTKKITQHIVDPETDRILKKFFGDVCPAFLENRCTMPQCQRNHVLLSEAHVYPLIIDAPFDTMKSIFNVTLRFHRLFQSYISIFVEVCIRNKDNAGLIGLVQACDRFPRTITCYKDIVRKLVEKNYMKEHKAISFIIDNHTDSEIARDTILSMILDSGPCLTFFLNYIEKIHLLQPIRMDVFSRILHTCVATQNPKLPYFCLNYLQGCSSSQISTLNSHYIKTFLEMNKFLSEINENRESKTLLIAEKLLHSGN